MIKGILQRGDTMFVVRIEHYVTFRTFVTALTENYYGKNESFPKKLTKKEAEGIKVISVNISATDNDDDTIFDSTEIIVCHFYADGFHLVECEDGFDILLNILENKDNNLKNIALCRY